MYYRLLKQLLSDNNNNFLANIMEYYLQKLYIQNNYINVHHPQTNGIIDNLNDTLGELLTK